METLIELLAFGSLAHLIVEFLQGTELNVFKHKPFSCNLCMGYWVSIIPFTYWYGFFGIALAATAGIVSDLIYKTLSRP